MDVNFVLDWELNQHQLAQMHHGVDMILAETSQAPPRLITTIMPAELLTEICNSLISPADICSVRSTCRAFRDASFPAFARSFNDRVFTCTPNSLTDLQSIASVSRAVPYIKRLILGTCIRYEKNPEGLPVLPSLTRANRKCVPSESVAPRADVALPVLKERAHRLRRALVRLSCLEEIVIQDGTSQSVCHAEFIVRPLTCSDSLCTFSESRASSILEAPVYSGFHLVQEVMLETFIEATSPSPLGISSALRAHSVLGDCLAKLRCLTITAPISLDMLPYRSIGLYGAAWSPCPQRLRQRFTGLLRFEITLAQPNVKRNPAELSAVLLVQLLAMLPHTLQDLTIRFPNYGSRYAVLPPDAVVPMHRTDPMYGGFLSRMGAHLYYPRLRRLHLAHLELEDHIYLQRFLTKHAATLRDVKFTRLALRYSKWRPWIADLADHLSLDSFELETTMSPLETRVNHIMVSKLPQGWVPTLNEFRRAAARTVLVGAAAPDGDRTVLVRGEGRGNADGRIDSKNGHQKGKYGYIAA